MCNKIWYKEQRARLYIDFLNFGNLIAINLNNCVLLISFCNYNSDFKTDYILELNYYVKPNFSACIWNVYNVYNKKI